MAYLLKGPAPGWRAFGYYDTVSANLFVKVYTQKCRRYPGIVKISVYLCIRFFLRIWLAYSKVRKRVRKEKERNTHHMLRIQKSGLTIDDKQLAVHLRELSAKH